MRSISKMAVVFAVAAALALPVEARPKRRCSATCTFSSGTIVCARGSEATCGCSSVGTFQGACNPTGTIVNGGGVGFVSDEQRELLLDAAGMIYEAGPRGDRLGDALTGLAAAHGQSRIEAAERELDSAFKSADADLQARLLSFIKSERR